MAFGGRFGGARASAAASDEELVARVLAGQKERYAELVRRYQDMLYRHAVGMVLDRDVAADLVQDTLVKAYTSLDQCRDASRFRTWVFRILRNRCLDHLRSPRYRDASLDEGIDAPVDGGGPELELDRSELRSLLESVLMRLPEAQREAFLLKHVQNLSYEEMADLLGASVGALKMRVMRARETLQALLKEAGAVEEGQ